MRSRPTRARGLKQSRTIRLKILHLVAPHTGAWIETNAWDWVTSLFHVAPHTGAWIETLYYSTRLIVVGGRAPHGRVD